MAEKDQKISAEEIIESLKTNANFESPKKLEEFTLSAKGIVDENNKKFKKVKIIFGISFSLVLLIIILLALLLPVQKEVIGL